jgi:hypothetical protein
VGAKLLAFLTSALNGDERSAPRGQLHVMASLPFRKEYPVDNSQSQLGHSGGREISFLYKESDPGHSA